MDTVINVALPVFAIILVGWLAARAKLLGREASAALNQFVYWFALPPVLFLGVARAPLADIFNGPFLGAFMGGLAITYVAGFATGWLFTGRRPRECSMQALNASFSNTGYMGIPLFLTLVGSQHLAPVIIATVIMSAVMVAVAIIMLETLGTQARALPAVLTGIGRALLTNPLVMSSALGLAAALLHIPIPSPIGRFGDLMGASAGPCALFAIGLFLAGQRLSEGLLESLWISLLKLILQPLVTWVLLETLFPVDPYWRASALVLAALPTGALTFVMAQRYDTYVGETSSAILVSTLLSVITLSGILIALAPIFHHVMAG